MKVGAICFNTDNNIVATDRTLISLDNAWASVGGAPARRVQTIHDLPNDVLWLTNLGYSQMNNTGLHKHPNFKADNWLRTSVNQLMGELGIDHHRTPPNVISTVLADVAQRVLNIAINTVGVKPLSPTLNADIATAIKAPKSTLSDNIYSLISPVAEHRWVNVIAVFNHAKHSPTCTVRPNRLAHARTLLSMQLPPDTGWEYERSLPKDKSDSWLEKIDRPFLALCQISNMRPMIGEILSWGSGSKIIRNWLTDIEWREIRQYADIRVESALICVNEPITPPQRELIPNGSLDDLSMTLGLVAEQLWTSLTIKQPYRFESQRYSAAAAWIRAADRMIMFNYAQKASARGVDVMGYGTGCMTVRYPEGGLRRALDITLDMGLMPPANKFLEALDMERMR